jgi:hypothetical protein
MKDTSTTRKRVSWVGSERIHLLALRACTALRVCPGGTFDNSPAIYRCVSSSCGELSVPPGTAECRRERIECALAVSRPWRDLKRIQRDPIPAMNRCATINNPYGMKTLLGAHAHASVEHGTRNGITTPRHRRTNGSQKFFSMSHNPTSGK